MALAKVAKYENFLDTRLKPDLVHAISLSSDLTRNIQMLQQNGLKKMRTMINLGSEVYAQADVPDTSRIFVNIGLGFHVEFTLDEALVFIDSKQTVLKREVEDHSRSIASIKSHIKLVTEGIRELMNIPAEV